MQLHTLKRPDSLKRPYRRVGRGQSSTRGKQSGRGGKGQTARAGAKIRPALRDIIKKIPKRRGFGKNRGRTHVPHQEPLALPLARLEHLFDSDAEISMRSLIEMKVVRADRPVKIVGGGELKKKLSIKDIPMSESARKAIESAGGRSSSGGKAGGNA